MARWPDLPADLRLRGIAGRVLDAARDLRDSPTAVGDGDLYSLVWHWLRHDSLNSGVKSRLTIPAISPWPSATQWRDRGFTVADLGAKLTISAAPWAPKLEGPLPAIDLALAAPGDVHVPERDELLSTKRRAYSGIPADPFFADVFPPVNDGEPSYRTSAQRETIRAVLTAPPGASIVVSLPTGGGKSAVAIVPSLIGSPDDLSLFIMPTTALALDQERAVQGYQPLRGKLAGPLAYHSGLDSTQKEGFHDRIRSGTQRILFTSPEAALRSLRGALFAAAEAGRLKYFVVDEAHMISEWGDEFRPEFQHLAGLRWDLLRLANQAGDGFRTLLMSATLTRTSLETLQALFGSEHFQVVASVSVRPEPFFFSAGLSSREERLARLPELINLLPKPLVVYVTKKSDAADIIEELRQIGFRRIGMVTGETLAEERRRVINDWRRTESGTRIDVVVANSAFGLGIDMDEIRTVIHACIPETFDRFYQEVGRGGRDGHACLSVFLPVKSDWGTATSLSAPTLIGKIKASDRWERMRRNSTPLGASRYRVDIRDHPSHLFDSRQSRAWNLRTLALMSRAGLIRLRAEEPPRFGPEVTEEERRSAHAEHENTVIVELTEAGSRVSEAWDRQFEQARSNTYTYFRRSLARVRNLVHGGCPFEHARDTYAVSSFPLEGDHKLTIIPQGSCGGCVRHGFRAEPNTLDVPAPPARASDLRPAPKLARLFQKKSTLLVTHSKDDSTKDFDRVFRGVIQMLVQNGIVEFIEDGGLARDPRVRRLHHLAPDGFIFFSRELTSPTRVSVPTAVFVSDAVPVRSSLFYRPADSTPCIVIASDGLAAPWKPEVTLGRAWSPHWPITDFEAALL